MTIETSSAVSSDNLQYPEVLVNIHLHTNPPLLVGFHGRFLRA
jgi:hypothetical protein